MSPRLDDPSTYPGQTPIAWRDGQGPRIAAGVASVAWPPLILPMLFWPPHSWMPGADTDPRLIVLVIAIIAAPAGLWLIDKERLRTGRPATRLAVIWRYALYGGLLAAGLEVLFALLQVIQGWIEAGDFMQAVGATETKLLIYGVGGLPLAILVGVSYALWAGICTAFIAFRSAPEVKDRLGVFGR